MTAKRLDPMSFDFPIDKMMNGYYADIYFMREQEILRKENCTDRVTLQIFQRDYAVLCGVDEAIALIKRCSHNPESIKIRALHDGDEVEPWETIMTIEGNPADFAHLETVYLGILARQTKVATNCRRCVKAAGEKPVLFFPARFDHYLVQESDGYAAKIGGMAGISTPANAKVWGVEAAGTIPHALIASLGGDSVKAAQLFDKYMPANVARIALVDFDNDCVGTSLKVAHALGDKLAGVRLDTSGTMVDKSLADQMGHFQPTGVNAQLVHNVRTALDAEGFTKVKIVVSGGFTPERIQSFEAAGVPVDVYAVGSYIYSGNTDFTSDVVLLNGKNCAKAGRRYSDNPRLEDVY